MSGLVWIKFWIVYPQLLALDTHLEVELFPWIWAERKHIVECRAPSSVPEHQTLEISRLCDPEQ